jgi:hypothetical protein
MIFSIPSADISVLQTLIASHMHIKKISLPGCCISLGLKYIKAATKDAADIEITPTTTEAKFFW